MYGRQFGKKESILLSREKQLQEKKKKKDERKGGVYGGVYDGLWEFYEFGKKKNILKIARRAHITLAIRARIPEEVAPYCSILVTFLLLLRVSL